jgi:hypothetical protein
MTRVGATGQDRNNSANKNHACPGIAVVGGLRTDATSEPGNVLLFILADAAPVAGAAAYPE